MLIKIRADEIFKNPSAFEGIESALDEDRMEGEWANMRMMKSVNLKTGQANG